jgi:hypothetical protein
LRECLGGVNVIGPFDGQRFIGQTGISRLSPTEAMKVVGTEWTRATSGAERPVAPCEVPPVFEVAFNSFEVSEESICPSSQSGVRFVRVPPPSDVTLSVGMSLTTLTRGGRTYLTIIFWPEMFIRYSIRQFVELYKREVAACAGCC